MRTRKQRTVEEKGAPALKKAKAGEGSSDQAGAPRSRYPPFPTSGKIQDLQKWNEECHKISEMLKKDPDRILYAKMKPKDSDTTNAVQSLEDKMMVLRAARGVVCVSIMHDGERLPQCSGIIIRHWSETPARHHAIIVTCSEAVCIEGRKLDPLPKGGNGGMVIDHSGEVRGMAHCWKPHPAVISVSTIVKCVDMFQQFNRIARPILGLNVRTIAMLDVQLLEDLSNVSIKSGYLVDKVQYDSDAENHGIKLGHVIISINGRDALTLPEMEDYLLSIGLDYLRDNCLDDIKLIVCELRSGVRREVVLPARFSDTCQRLDAWED